MELARRLRVRAARAPIGAVRRSTLARLLALSMPALAIACVGDPPRADDAGAAVDASAEDAAASSDADGAGLDGAPADAAIADAGRSDATPPADAGRIELACLGDARPIVLSHGLPFATVRVGAGAGAPSGLFLLDLATTASAIDLDAFTPRPEATGCDPSRLFQRCGFADLDFFGSWGPVTLITQDLRGLGGGVREAGILGTDFSSVLAITLDYGASEVRAAPRGALCSDAALAGAGLGWLSTAGFYANDLSSLRPMTDVDATASPGTRVPNVPTIPVRLGGVDAIAQLDTGFDDALAPRTINVNEALWSAILAADPDALVRDAAGDLALTTCVVGVTEDVEAWTLAPGHALELLQTDGTAAASLVGVRVFVKRTPSSARVCGGIGTWTAPASQLAASLHAELGLVVVDPFTSRVWIPRR